MTIDKSYLARKKCGLLLVKAVINQKLAKAREIKDTPITIPNHQDIIDVVTNELGDQAAVLTTDGKLLIFTRLTGDAIPLIIELASKLSSLLLLKFLSDGKILLVGIEHLALVVFLCEATNTPCRRLQLQLAETLEENELSDTKAYLDVTSYSNTGFNIYLLLSPKLNDRSEPNHAGPSNYMKPFGSDPIICNDRKTHVLCIAVEPAFSNLSVCWQHPTQQTYDSCFPIDQAWFALAAYEKGQISIRDRLDGMETKVLTLPHANSRIFCIGKSEMHYGHYVLYQHQHYIQLVLTTAPNGVKVLQTISIPPFDELLMARHYIIGFNHELTPLWILDLYTFSVQTLDQPGANITDAGQTFPLVHKSFLFKICN